MEGVAGGSVTQADLAAWFRARLRRPEPPRAQAGVRQAMDHEGRRGTGEKDKDLEAGPGGPANAPAPPGCGRQRDTPISGLRVVLAVSLCVAASAASRMRCR